MAEEETRRPEYTHTKIKNAAASVTARRVWNNKSYTGEVPISSAYPVIDSDLARDNIENDIPAADLQDI